MRILQVTNGYSPQIGGLENHLQILSEGLAAQGHEVTVATLACDLTLPTHELMNGVQVHRYPGIGPRGFEFPIGMQAALMQQRHAYDVVHAHNYGGLPLLFAANVFRNRLFLSLHYHGHTQDLLPHFLHKVYDPCVKPVLKQADWLICNSHGEAQLVIKNLDICAERTKIIPSLFSVSPQFDLREKLRILRDQEKTYILFVGRLVKYKNVGTIIASLRYLPTQYELVVIGNGPDYSRLKKMSRQYKLDSRVHLLGFISKAELANWYDRANLAITLSAYESFGRTIVEALNKHCKVVCSDIPAFADFMEVYPQMVRLVSKDIHAAELAKMLIDLSSAPVVPVDLGCFRSENVLPQFLEAYQKPWMQ